MDCTAANHSFFKGKRRSNPTERSRTRGLRDDLQERIEESIFGVLTNPTRKPVSYADVCKGVTSVLDQHFGSEIMKHLPGDWSGTKPDSPFRDLNSHIHTGVDKATGKDLTATALMHGVAMSPRTTGAACDFTFDDFEEVRKVMRKHDDHVEPIARVYPKLVYHAPGIIRNIEIKGLLNFDMKGIQP